MAVQGRGAVIACLSGVSLCSRCFLISSLLMGWRAGLTRRASTATLSFDGRNMIQTLLYVKQYLLVIMIYPEFPHTIFLRITHPKNEEGP